MFPVETSSVCMYVCMYPYEISRTWLYWFMRLCHQTELYKL